MHVTLLRLPAVHSTSSRGKLGLLNRLGPLRPIAKALLRDLAPMTDTQHVAKGLVNLLAEPHHVGERFIGLGEEPGWLYRLFQLGANLGFVLVCILLLPILVAVWIAVRLGSDGPGLFVQNRVGRHERSFKCAKFRTMAKAAPQGGSHDVGDAFITPLGNKLRKFKLDELPQAVNIACGTLTLIGPRPGLPNMPALTEARQRQGVFRVRPGITGLGQVNGVDMSTPEVLAMMDQRYIASRAVLTDLKIILATVRGGGHGDAAVKGASNG